MILVCFIIFNMTLKGVWAYGREMAPLCLRAAESRDGSRIFRGGWPNRKNWDNLPPMAMAPNLVLQLGILVLLAPFLSLWARVRAKVCTFPD